VEDAMKQKDDRHSSGLDIRRRVLGAEYVDKQIREADDFTRDFQDFLNTNCWDAVWTRPGLDHKTRSMLTLAILAATNKYTELAAHTRGALVNGCSPEEIREIFLHVGVYAGIPSAVEAFRAARPVISAERPAAS
jgi:4-carboxymuconolactone decarboxylase